GRDGRGSVVVGIAGGGKAGGLAADGPADDPRGNPSGRAGDAAARAGAGVVRLPPHRARGCGVSGAAIGATAGVADAEVSNATVYRLLAEMRQEMRAMQRPAPVEALTVADCAKALKVGENTVRA